MNHQLSMSHQNKEGTMPDNNTTVGADARNLSAGANLKLARYDLPDPTHFAIITKAGEPAIATPQVVFTLDGKPLCVGVFVTTLDNRTFRSLVTQTSLRHQVKDTNLQSKETAASAKIAGGKHGTEPCRFMQTMMATGLVVLPRVRAAEFKELAKEYLTAPLIANLDLVIERGAA